MMYIYTLHEFTRSLKHLVPDFYMTENEIIDSVAKDGIDNFIESANNPDIKELAELTGMIESAEVE